MARSLPDLSRFELQCLRRLWGRGEGSVRDVQGDFPDAPSYSTFRKFFERLEAKGAVRRVRREGRAWIYRSTVPASGIIRREVRRLIDGLFDGRSRDLLAHLADADDLTLEDLRQAERVLREGPRAVAPNREAGPARGRRPLDGRRAP
jgi:predicted transcriptional regulator